MGEKIKYFWCLLWRGKWKPFEAVLFMIGAYDTITAQFLSHSQLPIMVDLIPQWQWWIWVILFLIFALIAVTEGSYRLQRNLQPNLMEQLHTLIKEGKRLQSLSVVQGESTPILMVDHWRTEVANYLHSNFGQRYIGIWEARAISGKPQREYTGIASDEQKTLWNRIAAGLEQLESLQKQMKDTNK